MSKIERVGAVPIVDDEAVKHVPRTLPFEGRSAQLARLLERIPGGREALNNFKPVPGLTPSERQKLGRLIRVLEKIKAKNAASKGRGGRR